MLMTPPPSLRDAPPIFVQPFGQRLTNINATLSATQLRMINDGPDYFFATSAEVHVNGSLTSVSVRG